MLVSDGQAAVAGEPGEGALYNPAVSSEMGAALNPTARDAWDDAAGTAFLAAAAMVIGLVGVELARPAPRAATMAGPDRRHGVQGRGQHTAVVAVGAAERQAKRRTTGVRDKVALGARLAAIRRVRSDFRAPLLAAMLALSSAARRQSICPAACRRSSKARCKAAQTPASCQSRSLRQQLIPEPHPISEASISQGRPDRSTNRMPVSAALSGRRGRPPFGLGRSRGKSGSIAAQRSSGTRGFAMLPKTLNSWFR